MGRSVWGFWQSVFSTAVLYGSLALFTSILHNVFLLYYVETFVSIYKIDKISFWVGEVSKWTNQSLFVIESEVDRKLFNSGFFFK